MASSVPNVKVDVKGASRCPCCRKAKVTLVLRVDDNSTDCVQQRCQPEPDCQTVPPYCSLNTPLCSIARGITDRIQAVTSFICPSGDFPTKSQPHRALIGVAKPPACPPSPCSAKPPTYPPFSCSIRPPSCDPPACAPKPPTSPAKPRSTETDYRSCKNPDTVAPSKETDYRSFKNPGSVAPPCSTQRPFPKPRLSLSNAPRCDSPSASANCSPSGSNSSNTSCRSLSKWGQQREEEKKRQQYNDCQDCQGCMVDSQYRSDCIESQTRKDPVNSQSQKDSVESQECKNCNKSTGEMSSKNRERCTSKRLEEFVCSKCTCQYRDSSNKHCYNFERSKCIVCRSQRQSESIENIVGSQCQRVHCKQVQCPSPNTSRQYLQSQSVQFPPEGSAIDQRLEESQCIVCRSQRQSESIENIVGFQCQRVHCKQVQCPSPNTSRQPLQSQSVKCPPEGSAIDKRLEESGAVEETKCQCGKSDVLLSCTKNETNWQCDCACLNCKAKWQYTGDGGTPKVTCTGQCPTQSQCSDVTPVKYYQKSVKRPCHQESQHTANGSICSKCGDGMSIKTAENVSSSIQKPMLKGVHAQSSHISPDCPCRCETSLVCTCIKVGNSWQCETTCMECQAKWETQGQGKHGCVTRMKNSSNSSIAELPWSPCQESKFQCPKRLSEELSCENIPYCPYANSCATNAPCEATTQNSCECDIEKAATCDAATDYKRDICIDKRKERKTASLTDYEVKVMANHACNSIPKAHVTLHRSTYSYSGMPSLGGLDPSCTRYSGFTSLDRPFSSGCDARPRCLEDALPIKPYPTLCNRSSSRDAQRTRRTSKETYSMPAYRKYS